MPNSTSAYYASNYNYGQQSIAPILLYPVPREGEIYVRWMEPFKAMEVKYDKVI